jgi:uncharacterized membrane protein YfcA
VINPFTIRRVWREHSLTLALVVALAVAGVSAWGTLYETLRHIHVPWLAAVILPFVIVGLVARYEQRIVKNPALRRWLALGLLAVAVAIWLLR